jgi:AcrR family transcriptional regulator
MPPPSPSRRAGRPRSADADRAILAATRSALVELGWSGLTLGDVAARAGVAKTTLYRRWAGKNELVVDAVAALFEEQLELPDLGSLEADIHGVVMCFAGLLDRPETRTALMAVVAEATNDEALRLRIREAIVDRQKHLVLTGRKRAQQRGELPPDEDSAGPGGQGGAGGPDRMGDPARDDLIFDVIAGAVVHRLMVSSQPVDDAWAESLAHLLVAGLAGLHTGRA